MKTKSTIVVAAVAVLTLCNLQHATAQNSSPFWSLAGNSNASSSTSKLGTTNTIPLRFFTNNSERMRIDGNGNVGINATTLGASRFIVNGSNPFRAQVNGSTKFIVNSNGGVSVGSSSTGPSNGLFVSGNVGIGTSTPVSTLDISSSSSFQLARFNGPSSSMYLGLYENGIYRGYIGSYAGNNEDVDFGTGAGTSGKLHLTIQANPMLTIDQNGNVGIGTT